LQTIRLIIIAWDGRCDWLQTTAEHDVVWSSWAGDHGELSSTHLNREWKFHTKSHELIDVSLACPPDSARGPPVLYAPNAVYRCVVACRQLYPSCGFPLADCRCFQVSNPSLEIHATAFTHHTALTDRDF